MYINASNAEIMLPNSVMIDAKYKRIILTMPSYEVA